MSTSYKLTAADIASLDLTQEEAVKRFGVSPQYLRDILKGRRRLSARVAVRLEVWGIAGSRRYLEQAKEDLNAARAVLKGGSK